MHPHAYKKRPEAETPRYSPVAAVMEHGDSWMIGISGLNPATALALRSLSPDWRDAFDMNYMEKGIIPRVR